MSEPRSLVEGAAERAAHARDGEVSAHDRKRHGIVHTPAPIALFVARSVDAALRSLGRRRGLADRDVCIVDPACGPGAFLAAALSAAAPGAPRMALGLDRDEAAIERARALLGPAAQAAGWPLRLEATDTLTTLDVLRTEERAGATLAILGNPPWAGRSASRGEALSDVLLDDFRRDDAGRSLDERRIGVLSDAYVRFVRWAAELARHAQGGAVVALVTNASFLDGPVHRGVRAALARWFARLDVVHLGGSALIARRGDRDDNVFGVRPSVAITLALRPADHDEGAQARVRFTRVWGARDEKLAILDAACGIDGLALEPLETRATWIPAARVGPSYERWPSLAALMPFHREGLQSNRDAFCVDDDRERLLDRLRAFAAGAGGPWPGRAGVPSRHYDPERARRALARALDAGEACVAPVAYRPLDVRWMAIAPSVCHRPRDDLRAAFACSGAALLTVRKDRGERAWAHFGASRHPPDNCFLSARSSCRTRAFPTCGPDGAPNVDVAELSVWAEHLDVLPVPHTLLRYVLAVLASATYCERYDAALRADYPRIPPPRSEQAFQAAVGAGAALENAFAGAREEGEPLVVVGHHRVASAALACAIAGADEAVRLMIPR